MKSLFKIVLFISGLIIMEFSMKGKTPLPEKEKSNPVLVIHGGAGTILKKNMTKEKEEAYRAKLESIIITGMKLLKEGKASVDVVEHVICIMEDSPLFNAGKGSVFNHEGKQEMDASIMDGKSLNAGAVAGVSNIKNPILAARLVMDNSNHVLLSGTGAEQFAKEQNLES